MALRIVFFGTPAFAVPTLQALLDSKHAVVGVATQPDRPRGRGQRVTEGPVKTLAVARGVPVLQPERIVRDQLEPAVRSLDADLGVVAAYGKILPEWLLALPRLGLINVHASLLPKYRGASPIHRAVIDGETETGVTIMRVVKALDAGAMLATVRVPIGPDETTDAVERRLASAGGALLVQTVDRLSNGPVEEVPQDEARASYAPRLRKEDGSIDWTRPAHALHNQIRGLHPWPHAFTVGPHGRIIVHRSAPAEASTQHQSPGTVIAANPQQGLVVATGDGALELVDVQAEGGRVTPARVFLHGHALSPGDRLGSP